MIPTPASRDANFVSVNYEELRMACGGSLPIALSRQAL